MKLEKILNYAKKSKKTFSAKISRSNADDSPDRFALYIRKDVENFSKQSKWQYIWVDDEEKLYVGYGHGEIVEYKKQAGTEFDHIVFTDERLSKYIDKGEMKHFHIGFDSESGLYFIQFTKKEGQQTWPI